MSYTKPKDVVSPKVNISNVVPIIDRGEWDFSVALLNWDREPCVAVRWNGGTEDGVTTPGNPQSRGLPTWFICPDDYYVPVLEASLKIGFGGGDINVDEAKKAVHEALAKKNASAPSPSDAELEKRIIKVIKKMKADGKI